MKAKKAIICWINFRYFDCRNNSVNTQVVSVRWRDQILKGIEAEADYIVCT